MNETPPEAPKGPGGPGGPGSSGASPLQSRVRDELSSDGIRLLDAIRERSRSFPLRLRYVVGALVLLLGVATVVGVTVSSLAHAKPTWWGEVDATSPAALDLAERVERGLMQRLHRARPAGEPWTLSISTNAANAWLNAKMPRWLESRGTPLPHEVAELQVRFEDGRVAVGARIRTEHADQIVAATVEPMVRYDGSLWMAIVETNAGRLDLPSSWSLDRLRSWLPAGVRNSAESRAVLRALEGEGPLLSQAFFTLADDRRIQIIGVEAENGLLNFTCTLAPEQPK